MGKKVSKSNTPVWVWVIIFIILLQIAKLAHTNDWFSSKDKNIRTKENLKVFDSKERKFMDDFFKYKDKKISKDQELLDNERNIRINELKKEE